MAAMDQQHVFAGPWISKSLCNPVPLRTPPLCCSANSKGIVSDMLTTKLSIIVRRIFALDTIQVFFLLFCSQTWDWREMGADNTISIENAKLLVGCEIGSTDIPLGLLPILSIYI